MSGHREQSQFRSPFLVAVEAAFSSRRKAISYHTHSFKISREVEDTGTEPPERLNIDIETLESPESQVRLSVWPDGVLWFRACQPGKQGWRFLVAFSGHLESPVPSQMVDWFEASLPLLHGASRGSGYQERLLEVWTASNPVVERSV